MSAVHGDWVDAAGLGAVPLDRGMRPRRARARLLRRAAAVAVLYLSLSPGALAADACAQVFSGSDGPEAKVAMAVGFGATYSDNPEVGLARATECLLAQFDRSQPHLPQLPAESTSRGLLVLLAIEPSTWIHTASHVETSVIDAWLKKPIRMAQAQYLGPCASPDLFARAHDALARLTRLDDRERALQERLMQVLGELHCRVPQ